MPLSLTPSLEARKLAAMQRLWQRAPNLLLAGDKLSDIEKQAEQIRKATKPDEVAVISRALMEAGGAKE